MKLINTILRKLGYVTEDEMKLFVSRALKQYDQGTLGRARS